jgi:ElaB/YqjD/DUF883 family membrane-anchored ribosome-binding protein
MSTPTIRVVTPGGSRSYLPEAEELAARVDKALAMLQERFKELSTPDPAWAIYRQEEALKRLKTKQEQGRSRIASELKSLQSELERLLKSRAEKYEQALRPLQTSPLTSEQSRGQYFEERAERRARRMNLEQLSEEHRRAMGSGLTDYATELVEYGELMADPEEAPLARELRARHLAALGLENYAASFELLEKKLKILKARGELIRQGRDLSEAAQSGELQNLMYQYDRIMSGL